MKSFRIVSSTKSEEQICLSFYDKKLGLEIDQASKIQLFRDTTEQNQINDNGDNYDFPKCFVLDQSNK